MVCVPIFLWLILTYQNNWALLVLMLSGVSDYLDGKIARHYNQVTRVGQLLDPLADRLYILSTLLGLAWREIIPWWLVAILVAREIFGTALLLVVPITDTVPCQCISSARLPRSTFSAPFRWFCSDKATAYWPQSPYHAVGRSPGGALSSTGWRESCMPFRPVTSSRVAKGANG